MKRKHGDDRRTEISGEEIGNIDLEDLITEETMVVTISHQRLHQADAGQRLPGPAPRRQGAEGRQDRRGRPDPAPVRRPARTPTCCSSPTSGKVYWQKVYDLPQLGRESRGRAIVNLLNLAEGETDRRLPRRARLRRARPLPDDGHAQRTGQKDAALRRTAGRMKGGIIAIKLARTTSWSTSSSPSRATRSCWPPPAAWRSASTSPTPGRWAATPAA